MLRSISSMQSLCVSLNPLHAQKKPLFHSCHAHPLPPPPLLLLNCIGWLDQDDAGGPPTQRSRDHQLHQGTQDRAGARVQTPTATKTIFFAAPSPALLKHSRPLSSAWHAGFLITICKRHDKCPQRFTSSIEKMFAGLWLTLFITLPCCLLCSPPPPCRCAPQGLPDADVVRVLLVCIMKSINMTGKNQMQIMQVRNARGGGGGGGG